MIVFTDELFNAYHNALWLEAKIKEVLDENALSLELEGSYDCEREAHILVLPSIQGGS